MVRYEAFVDRDWQDKGITQVAVTRTRENGWLEAGVFLVDLYCLGVKDAFSAEMSASEWADEAARLLPPENRASIHPACARKLVEGAVAYALALGFSPPRDYKKARHVFGSVKAQDCPNDFTYGKDGKPLYIAGPNDDEERIARVLRVLTAKLGQDGFHYIVPEEPDEADEFAREELQDFLQQQPEKKVGFAGVDGFCTAIHVCPTAMEPSEFLPAVWSGTPPRFRDKDEARKVDRLLLDYWDEIGDRLDFGSQDDDPGAVVDFGDGSDEDGGLRQRAAAWCGGFLHALREWPEAWNGATDRTDLRPHFDAIAMVAAYAGGPAPTGVIAPAAEKDLPRYVGAAVLALYKTLRPKVADDSPAGDG